MAQEQQRLKFESVYGSQIIATHTFIFNFISSVDIHVVKQG